MTRLAFVDVETTGLDQERHEVWEAALIERLPLDGEGLAAEREHVWQLPVDLGRADAMALTVGRFYERRTDVHHLCALSSFASDFARRTNGAHLVGCTPSFDAAFLSRLLRANGACPGWHYHLVDVEALAVGWLSRNASAMADRAEGDDALVAEAEEMRRLARPPWKSTDLSLAVGVDPATFDRHTALGDARWARAIYDAVMS